MEDILHICQASRCLFRGLLRAQSLVTIAWGDFCSRLPLQLKRTRMPSAVYQFALRNSLVPFTHLGGEGHCEWSVLLKNKTQRSLPGLEPLNHQVITFLTWLTRLHHPTILCLNQRRVPGILKSYQSAWLISFCIMVSRNKNLFLLPLKFGNIFFSKKAKTSRMPFCWATLEQFFLHKLGHNYLSLEWSSLDYKK